MSVVSEDSRNIFVLSAVINYQMCDPGKVISLFQIRNWKTADCGTNLIYGLLFLFEFSLEYSCFTMLCSTLYSNVQQSESVIWYIYPLFSGFPSHLGQSYGFSSSHVWMWELKYKESWALKNWCFWTVVLEKTLESPFDCREIQPVHSKGDQSSIFIGRSDAEAETPIIWPRDGRTESLEKTDAGKDWRQEKGTTEDDVVGWPHRLNGHEFE